MRWSNLTLADEEKRRLPGYRDEAIVRHFDAPEAIATRFYEVRAKSILNRVPESSAVPFRWTINPYRGCTHSCSYCLAGETPVLLGNGRHKPISELEVGEEIYGTVGTGSLRRYTRTVVLDRWITVKPAYRVRLADGTEIIASGDHRFLTEQGWRYVANGAPQGAARPHLTSNNHLVGTGAFAPQPAESADYRRGYLGAVLRGDGTLGHGRHAPRGGGGATVGTLPLALSDLEALERTRSVDWPVLPSLEWCRGFLAGIFDAGGSWSGCVLRIANQDPHALRWIEACLHRLNFQTADDGSTGGCRSHIRINGGLCEHLRFFHLTDPAITRKRSIAGQLVNTFAELDVEAVEPLGTTLPLYDITTATGDFIANGVVSHNCFARPTHAFLGFDAGRDFEREIVVKVNAPEVLRAQLARPSWQGEHVALGTNTDPYQWAEGRYRLTRGIWEAMRDAGNPCSILTKSPLLLRDLDLMREINARTEFSAALSIPTLEEKAWRATEPRTPHPRARLEAVRALTDAGIRTGVLVAPIMPQINDEPAQLEELLDAIGQAGAAYVTGIALHLRGEVRGVFMEWLRSERPELVPHYEELYRRGAYMPREERLRLARLVRGHGLKGRRRLEGGGRPEDEETPLPRAGRYGHEAAARASESPRKSAQQSLF